MCYFAAAEDNPTTSSSSTTHASSTTSRLPKSAQGISDMSTPTLSSTVPTTTIQKPRVGENKTTSVQLV